MRTPRSIVASLRVASLRRAILAVVRKFCAMGTPRDILKGNSIMTGNEVRTTFLNYFARNGNKIDKSSPLLPAKAPTRLFANPGLDQFKEVLLGAEKRDYKRAVSSQKCVRAGGKHNDLDEVGKTARHHTFFEMLGNFSFGDYFKEDAIRFAWDLLVNEW